jgi:hypothetical protein
MDADFPVDAGIVNVATFGAIPGDGLDDSPAIQAAINASPRKVIYLANGVYDLGSTVTFQTAQTHVEGQSMNGVILRARAGFVGDAVVRMQAPVTGTLGNGFRKTLENVTIDVGSNAIDGLNLFSNNNGGIENVRIIDPLGVGDDGISATEPNVGPTFSKNVSVEGFSTSVKTSNVVYNTVWENLSIKNFRVRGIRNQNNSMVIRNLTVENTLNRPAIESTNASYTLVVGGSITKTGTAGTIAVANFTIGGVLNLNGVNVLRDVTFLGYATPIANKTAGVDDAGVTTNPAVALTVGEFVSGNRISALHGSPIGSLDLAIPQTPTVAAGTPTTWINVASFGALPNDGQDDTEAIQAAILSANAAQGRTTLYFPSGEYEVSKTLRVSGDLRKIEGLWSEILVRGDLRLDAAASLFKFEGLTSSTFVMEDIEVGQDAGRNSSFIEQAWTGDLVMRRIRRGSSAPQSLVYRNTKEGRLFVEDATGNGWEFNGAGHRVYAQQLNAEIPAGITKVINNGATVVILGLKTEQSGIAVATYNRGTTEVLGGILYPVEAISPTEPAFLSVDSNVSYTIPQQVDLAGREYIVAVRDTRNSVTLEVDEPDLLARGNGWYLSMYDGRSTVPTGTVLAPKNLLASPSANSIQLSWTVGGGQTIVERALVGTEFVGYNRLATLASSVSSYNDTTADATKSYVYRVRSLATNGLVSTPAFAAVQRYFEQGRYDLNETTGTVVSNAIATSLPGTAIGGPTWQPTAGRRSGALQFDGVNDVVELAVSGPSTGYLHEGFNEMSASMWIRPSSTTGTRMLLDRGRASGLALRINNGSLEALVRNGASQAFASTPFIANNIWSHVAVSFSSAGGLELFVNGVAVDRAESGFGVASHANAAGLGGDRGDDAFENGSADYYAGLIDDVRIFSVALPSTEFTRIMNQVANPAPIARADSYRVVVNTARTVTEGVLRNDTDASFIDTLQAALVSGPTNGTLTLNTNGTFTYQPNVGFVGTDSFRYFATDGVSASVPATVSLDVRYVALDDFDNTVIGLNPTWRNKIAVDDLAGDAALSIAPSTGGVQRPANFAGRTSPRLRFNYSISGFEATDTGKVEIFANGSWIEVLSVNTVNASAIPQLADINLSLLNVGADFQVRFRVIGDNRNDNLRIDNVLAYHADGVLAYDDFEAGLDAGIGWGSTGWAGNRALAADLSSADRMLSINNKTVQELSLNLAGQTNVRVVYDSRISGFEVDDQGVVEVWNGSTWTIIDTVNPTNSTAQWQRRSIAIPTSVLTSQFRLRFRMIGNANNDVWNIDDLAFQLG